ncbi:glycoside hydrolase family 10 protein [Baaleninema simplex]|uniref:glycoside hydrolase family 10 protein n=1 Tax=Baaleninema simplex TaxID=2862350 RepID=UPI00034DB1C3|nr:family 10 glycosylhydrolase [Baaleninema simplex]
MNPIRSSIASRCVRFFERPFWFFKSVRPRRFLWVGLTVATLLLTQVYAYARPSQPGDLATSPTTFNGHEFRGVWAASVVNIDWPSRPGLSTSQQQTELIRLLDRMQELNLNVLVLQVRPAGDALYNSSIEPWSYWLTGRQGQPPSPFYDPLEFAIEQAHARNIELHAWFNPYRAKLGTNYDFAPNHMARQFSQYAYRYGNLVWMDPGAPDVQDRTYEVITDVVRRYDVDGIHLDDYFYPYPEPGVEFPDAQTYGQYRKNGGRLSRNDWRRQNVNTLVRRLYEGIKAIKPQVKFGISPFGIYRPGQPAGITGMDQYDTIYADPKLWLEQGWVDYMAPQLYWRIDQRAQSYPVLLDWWLSHNPHGRHIYAGNYLSKLDNQEWRVGEYLQQVDISRRSALRGSLGNIFFSMKVFSENRFGVNQVFRSRLYQRPALVPPMPWLDAIAPDAPRGVETSANSIRWQPEYSEDVKSLALYEQLGDRWELKQVLSRDKTRVTVTPGRYALRTVDAVANESEAIVVSVGS